MPPFEADAVKDNEISFYKQKSETGWHFLISHILSEEDSLKQFGFDLTKHKQPNMKARISKQITRKPTVHHKKNHLENSFDVNVKS